MKNTNVTPRFSVKTPALLLVLLAIGCASPSRYVVKVNQDEIGEAEMLQVFGRQHQSMELALGDEQDIRKLVPRAVERRLLVQEAYRLGLDTDPAVLEGTARFENEQLSDLFRKSDVDQPVVVTQAELAAAYAQMSNKNLARQIVVASREKAEALRARALAGEPLESMARAESIAQSNKRGGLIIVQWGAPDLARERVVFALTEGQTSEVYESGLGWEFDQLEKRGPVEMPPLDEIQTSVEDVLSRRKAAAHKEAVDAALFQKYDVKMGACPQTLEALRKAQEGKAGDEVCASWKGGTLTAGQLARRMRPEGLAELPPDAVARSAATSAHDMVARVLYGYEGAARGWAARPEVVSAVRFKRENLMEDKLYADYVFKGIAVTDAEAKAFYEANKADFTRPAAYVLAHVLVDTQAEAVKARADALAGEPFEEIAKKRSKDAATASKGGMVGYASEEQLQGPFKVVVLLNEGELSDAIQSKYGWHVVKVVKKMPAHQLTWDEASGWAKERALQQKDSDQYIKWVTRLRETATVDVSDAGVEAMAASRLAALRQDEAEKKAKDAARKAKVDAEEARREASKKKAADAKAAAAKEGGAAAPSGAAADQVPATATPAAAPIGPAPAALPAPTPPAAPTPAPAK